MFIIVYLFLYYFLFPYVGNINGRHYQGPVYSFLLHSIQSKSDTRICFISTGFVRRKHQPRCSDAKVQRNAISCRKRDYSTSYSTVFIQGYDIDFKAYYNILSHIIHITCIYKHTFMCTYIYIYTITNSTHYRISYTLGNGDISVFMIPFVHISHV